MQVDDKDLIEIPIDELSVEIDTDGMPMAVPGGKSATGPAIETEGEPEVKPGPKAKKPEPPRIKADLETERERSAKLQRERDEMARQVEAERQARLKAEEVADTRTGQAFQSHLERIHAEMQTIDSGIAQSTNFINALKSDLKAALDANDGDRVSDIIAQQAEANATLTTLRQAKPSIEAEVRKAERIRDNMAKEPAKREEEPAAPQAQTKEAWLNVARNVAGERFVDWLHENPKYAEPNTKDNRKLVRFADQYADDHGQESLRTKAFRDAVEAEFAPPKASEEEESDDVAEDTQDDPAEAADKAPAARKAQAAAPVSRASAPGRPSSSGSIKLTPEQHAIAPDLYAADAYDGFDPEIKAKFPQWSATAARFQYHRDLQRAQKEKAHRFTS